MKTMAEHIAGAETNHAYTEAKLDRLAAESRQRPVWVRVGKMIDGTSNAVARNVDLVFDAKQIRFVGMDGSSPAPADLQLRQTEPDAILADWTVLPCLIEAHAHLFLDGAPLLFEQREQYLKQPADWMLARARQRWPKILACGVGAVRDAGDKLGVGLALAAKAKAERQGLSTAPWIDSPGPAIHHKGRYGSFMGQPIEDHAAPADCVVARVASGADRIKLLVSGIINFNAGQVTTPPQLALAEVSALVAAAKSHGRQTFAHASGTDGVENSIEGGVTTVEHGFFITETQLAKMRDRQIGWVPTFAPIQLQIDRAADLGWSDEVVGHLKRIIESHQQMLRTAHEMGVIVIAGSDAGSCGVPHGVGLIDEMVHMERAGMPATAILNSATGTNTATLDFPDKIGRIATGHRARMIFTKHDPAEAIANLRKEKIVLFDGAAIQGDADLNTEGL
jgi:imidazolonepropionase-like amidohydrolase